MMDAGEELQVEVGDKFFISFRVNSDMIPIGYGNPDYRTEFAAYHYNVPTTPQAWVFYEHDSVPYPTAKRGWHAVGGINLNIWYLINTPQPYPGAVIMGRKYHDLNNNGQWDEGEPGVPYWPISLSGRYNTSTQTDINGFYLFTHLDTGMYTISEGQVDGWISTHPINGQYQVYVPSYDTVRNIDFGNFKLSSILVRKFQDLDGNLNTADDRFPKLWNLNLYRDSINPQTLISTVNSNSYLSVQDLMPGTYIATESDSIGWISMGKISNGEFAQGNYNSDTLILGNGESGFIDFINYCPRIVVKKYSDPDGDFNTSSDRIKKTWTLSLYRDNIAEGNLYAKVINAESLVVYSPPPGFYIAVESDSLGWNHLGKIINKIPYLNSTQSDSFNYNSQDVRIIDFINFKPNKVIIKKIYDIDGIIATSHDRILKKWNLNLYKDTLNNLIASVSSSESLMVENLGDGTYIATEADSIGWYHIGKYIDGNFISAQSKADSFQISGGKIRNITFINTTPVITVRKFRDIDGDFSTVGDRMPTQWNLALYRNSVAPGNIVASVVSEESLVVKGLTSGVYIARESDSIRWTHIGTILNGVGAPSPEREIQFTINSSESYIVDFVNTSQSSITLRKFVDQDGDFRTMGDRTLKNWCLSLYKDSIMVGNLIGHVLSSPTLTIHNLEPAKYVAVEADSQSWVHISTVVNGISQGGTTVNYWTINLNTGESHVIDFVNFDLKRRKYWTAATNCDWSVGSNWEPPGVPIPGDTIIVSDLAHCALTIPPGAMLGSIIIAAGESVYVPGGINMSIAGDAIIEGNLIINGNDTPKISVDGNWIMRGNFQPGKSTVIFRGFSTQVIDGSEFYNVIFGDSSLANNSIIQKRTTLDFEQNIKTNGNLIVLGNLLLNRSIDALNDTLIILNPIDTALRGGGIMTRGSVYRRIQGGSLGNYQFESKDTYINFSGYNNYPGAVTLTVLPDTIPDNFGNISLLFNSIVDTTRNVLYSDSVSILNSNIKRANIYIIGEKVSPDDFRKINRVYIINMDDTLEYFVRLSLRYNQNEVTSGINENNMAILRMTSISDINELIKNIPLTYILQQNYPNPFNPVTQIKYSIPKESFVEIKVFDILGREIATLVNEKKQIGEYEVVWNPNDSPSGIYYYRIIAGDYIQTRKMLLLR